MNDEERIQDRYASLKAVAWFLLATTVCAFFWAVLFIAAGGAR